jgi:hypothetical protein
MLQKPEIYPQFVRIGITPVATRSFLLNSVIIKNGSSHFRYLSFSLPKNILKSVAIPNKTIILIFYEQPTHFAYLLHFQHGITNK